MRVLGARKLEARVAVLGEVTDIGEVTWEL